MQKFCGVNTVLKESWESMRADRFLNREDQLGRIFVRIILHGICTVEYTINQNLSGRQFCLKNLFIFWEGRV